MKCPFCGHAEQRVLDSRPMSEGDAIKRRRECESCSRRFTTYERPERPRLFVAKRDGKREEFDSEKLLGGMVTACHKRPVSLEDLRQAAVKIERDLFDQFDGDVASEQIGDRVMKALKALDHVAYVRFASVYKEFERPEQFADTVRSLGARRPVATKSRAY